MKKSTSNVENLTGLKHMQPLFVLANMMGQYQPNRIEKSYKPIKWYKCYSGCIILAIIGVYVKIQIDKTGVGIFTKTTAIVMNFMTITIFTIATIYAILENVFLSPSKLHLAFQKFTKIDRLLGQIENSKIVEHKYACWRLIGQHLAIFSIFAFDTVWSEAFGGNAIIEMSYLQVFEQYEVFVTFLLITNCFVELRNRFRSTNLTLAAVFEEKSFEKLSGANISKYVETLTVTYGLLTETVDLFNDLFGWQILLIFVYTLVELLTSLNIIALFIPRYDEIEEIEDHNIGPFIVSVLDSTVFSIVNNYILARLADNVYEEAKQTSLICYKILQGSHRNLVPVDDRQIRENLSFLAQEATLRSTKISAAGFFEVDYTMVFLLFTSVTTYIVVLIQFNM